MELDSINKFLDERINILIKNNKNLSIHDNKIELVLPEKTQCDKPLHPIRFSSEYTSGILEETRIVDSVYEREKLLVEKLDMVRAS